jgi:hypothetical protein
MAGAIRYDQEKSLLCCKIASQEADNGAIQDHGLIAGTGADIRPLRPPGLKRSLSDKT